MLRLSHPSGATKTLTMVGPVTSQQADGVLQIGQQLYVTENGVPVEEWVKANEA